jgi:hypothetical protein
VGRELGVCSWVLEELEGVVAEIDEKGNLVGGRGVSWRGVSLRGGVKEDEGVDFCLRRDERLCLEEEGKIVR